MVGDFSQETRNRATWSTAAARRDLDGGGHFTDPGERAALDYVREDVLDKPVLDLGVGTGRTVPLLRAITRDYRALDYLPEMVGITRRRYPDVPVEVGDARDLGEYPADHFALVYFSYNGIDAVPAADRRRIFRAVRRVLVPSGIFLFSTLNIEGPSFRERPWRLRVWPTRNPIRFAWRVVSQVAGAPLDLANWLRIRTLGECGPGYAVAPLSAHHYGVLAHYTTLARQLDELAAEGFTHDGPVFESRRGHPVSPGDDTSRMDSFTIVARRA